MCVCAARCSNVCTDPKLGTEWHDDDRRPWRRKGELSPWLPAGKPVTQGSLMLSLSLDCKEISLDCGERQDSLLKFSYPCIVSKKCPRDT